MRYEPTFTRRDCMRVLETFDFATGTIRALIEILTGHDWRPRLIPLLDESRRFKTNSWGYHAAKMIAFLRTPVSRWKLSSLPFAVFKLDGNRKLPFVTFSTLALATCPGKGACAKFCYSLKAWRYPSAFFRAVQNTLLLNYKPSIVREAWDAIPHGRTVRLYVDGDFERRGTLILFMEACRRRPDLQVYGYSKSWDLFLELDATGYDWPVNYMLNLSSGSKYDAAPTADPLALVGVQSIQTRMNRLPIVRRGGFTAVKDAAREKAALRAAGVRSFVCPDDCSTCIVPTAADPTSHACGSVRFQDIAILADLH